MVAQQKSPRNNAGFIYILKPLISIDGKDVVKIGMTKRPVAERVRELTTGSIVPLKIVYSLHVENAAKLERQLHTQFHARRLVGGGQEFFDVSADEVIAEVERIAAEVSRTRAQKALNAELHTFMADIGASRIQRQIETYFLVASVPCWLLLVFGSFKIAHSLWGSGYDVLVAAANFFVFPVLLIMFGSRLHRRVMNKYFEPRYRAAIEAKRDALRHKYPLASS